MLFRLRNMLFMKLQDLPLAFFNENKAGDLISRGEQRYRQAEPIRRPSADAILEQHLLMSGAAFFVLSLDLRLGIAALLPALGVVVFTKASSGWVKRKNVKTLQSLGGMSSEIQGEPAQLQSHRRANRMDYFRRNFDAANEANYAASVSAGFANGVFMPLYGLSNHLAQLLWSPTASC
ncbi:MAG: hypothetical protein WDO18_21550 [Acidobacteriota bacterium]